jgi:hypothetical protein
MNTFRSLLLIAALLLSACTTVSTKVVELKPEQKFPPTKSVEVLMQKPERGYVDIALIESSGTSEADMLNDAREKARELGADAIVRLETERMYNPPVAVYDPWYDPFFYGHYGWGRPWVPPYYHPWSHYRVVGGYYSYVMKAVAIRYTDKGSAAGGQ